MKSTSLLPVAVVFAFGHSDAADPRGHMQPLGEHRDPDGTIKAIDGFPSPLEFYTDYIVPGVPVLFRGAAKEMDVFDRWTDEYLSKNFGKAWVEVEEGKKENRDLSMWTESFSDFLRKYQGKDKRDRFRGNFYSVSAMPQEQRKEYKLPKAVDCPAFTSNSRGGMRQINHWFSSGGTSSVLHKDGFENINCLMDGNKDLVFIDGKKFNERDLYWDHSDNHHHSRIDCDKVNLKKFPKFQDVQWWKAHMDQGDCLYIPYGWYHHVKSHPGENQRNMAINLWWEMEKNSATRAKISKHCQMAPPRPTTAADVRFTREQLPEPPRGDYEDDDDL